MTTTSTSAGAAPLEEQLEVLLDFFRYFSELTASRREQPTDDLASAIANGRIDGEPLSDVEPRRTTSSSPAPDTTPPRTRSPAACTR